MGQKSKRNRRHAVSSGENTFDGLSVTATTIGTSATIRLKGYWVSAADRWKFLAIRGGANFLIGVYEIVSVDPGSNAWTLSLPCTTGAGEGRTWRLCVKV